MNKSKQEVGATKPEWFAFPAYLACLSFWVSGLGLENLFVSWVFLGVLEQSAAVFSQSRAFMSSMPLVVLLIGGLIADRVEAKRLLLVVTAIATFVPLILIAVLDQLQVWHMIAFGASMALLNALSEPARQAMVNRVTRIDIQRSIAIVFMVPSLLSMAFMALFGHLEALGLIWVLLTLCGIFSFAAISLLALPSQPPVPREKLEVVASFVALFKFPIVRDTIAMNFASSLFNAGGYIVAVPIIAREVYSGDALFFGAYGMAFLIGGIASNILLLLLMPLRKPGLVFTWLQLSRAVFLVLIVLKPSQWLFLVLIGLWGCNMGVTSTLMRSTVQELAPERHRAGILSVMLFCFMLSSPISSLVIGKVIELSSPLMGLVPGIVLSLILFVWGFWFSQLRTYISPSSEGHQNWFKR